jgi:hypothetical protein
MARNVLVCPFMEALLPLRGFRQIRPQRKLGHVIAIGTMPRRLQILEEP